ncbi:MAG: DHH family phosphoesterase [Oscillospiraceae bacterium]|nr:DHH family phosphoesterase [Oscillospiraceae bacterium]
MKNMYRNNVLLAAVSSLVVCLLVLDVALFRNDGRLFWLTFPLLLIVGGLAIGKLIQIRVNEYAYYDRLDKSIDNANHMALVSFPLPVALVTDDRRIIWCNDSFTTTFFRPTDDESSIDRITEEPFSMLVGEGREIQKNGRWYRVTCRDTVYNPDEKGSRRRMVKPEYVDSANKVNILFFSDITGYKSLQDEYRKSKPVVMIISVDNYDDTVGTNRESDKTFVSVLIDQMLEKYFSEMNAVLRKISSDKFIVVVEDRFVQKMMEERVKLLEEARKIVVNDRTPVTLSIGVGRTAANLSESESYAWQALDKAIGRGGDQAVIRKESGYDYFGAETQRTERNGSSVRTRITADRIKVLMNSADAVYIMGHSYGDFDSVGAAIGLAAAIRRMGKTAFACVSRELDRNGNVKNLSEQLLVRFSEYDPPLIIEPKIAAIRFTENSLLFIVDTHIEKKVDSRELYDEADPSHIVVIDHHRKADNEIQAVISWVDPNASSTSEMVTDLLQYFGEAGNIQPLEAEALLAGITLDTKDFVMRTGEATFEAAARLKKLGADTILVKKLFATPIKSRMRKSKVVSSAELYRSFAISVVDESFEDIRVVCSQAADEMLNISGVDASVTVYPIEGGWSYSARSLGKVNVQVLMENIGNKKDDGGGHLTMAGAQLYNITKEEAVQKLHEAIDSYYDNLPKD